MVYYIAYNCLEILREVDVFYELARFVYFYYFFDRFQFVTLRRQDKSIKIGMVAAADQFEYATEHAAGHGVLIVVVVFLVVTVLAADNAYGKPVGCVDYFPWDIVRDYSNEYPFGISLFPFFCIGVAVVEHYVFAFLENFGSRVHVNTLVIKDNISIYSL